MGESIKKRVEWLDVAKGITILLMVAGHIYDNEIFRTLIYAFHMPFFMIVSGMLISDSKVQKLSWIEMIISKFKSLMIPYICTEICVIPLYCIKYGHGLKDLRWIITDSLLLYSTKGAATWFLLNLFLAEILYFGLLKTIKNRYAIWTVCIAGLVLSFLNIARNHLIIIWLRSLNFMFFLMVGNQFLKKIKTWNLRLLFLIIPFVGVALNNGVVECVNSNYHNEIFYLISAVMGTIIVFSISQLISKYEHNLKRFFVF